MQEPEFHTAGLAILHAGGVLSIIGPHNTQITQTRGVRQVFNNQAGQCLVLVVPHAEQMRIETGFYQTGN